MTVSSAFEVSMTRLQIYDQYPYLRDIYVVVHDVEFNDPITELLRAKGHVAYFYRDFPLQWETEFSITPYAGAQITLAIVLDDLPRLIVSTDYPTTENSDEMTFYAIACIREHRGCRRGNSPRHPFGPELIRRVSVRTGSDYRSLFGREYRPYSQMPLEYHSNEETGEDRWRLRRDQELLHSLIGRTSF